MGEHCHLRLSSSSRGNTDHEYRVLDWLLLRLVNHSISLSDQVIELEDVEANLRCQGDVEIFCVIKDYYVFKVFDHVL